MPSLGEIAKVRFEGPPPEVGEVPRSTYALLDATRNLELLDGPEPRTAQSVQGDTKPEKTPREPVDRVGSLGSELAEVARIFVGVEVSGAVEKEDKTIILHLTPPKQYEQPPQDIPPTPAEIRARRRLARKARLEASGTIADLRLRR